MAPTTQSLNAQNPNSKKVREVHEFDATPSTKGQTTPRTSTYSSWCYPSPATTTTTISFPSPPSSSSAAAATAQKQQLQPLDVTPSVISNFVVTGTDASFVGFTTPTGGGTGEVIPVSSPSPAPESESKPELDSEPGAELEFDSEPEAGSGEAATTAQEGTPQGTTSQTTVTPITTPQAGDDLTLTRSEEEEEEDAEAASRSRIKRQTEAARSVCERWLGVDGSST
ncbi:hypothetical protein B0H65DRAFT_48320 [Neurospora tetraspora]|uniref:Uncharacterized protein n=1 Tax=Neurospora tetraspora TaxID=94610 RepID=A0AAE0JPS9_9PEZI|nr:hypothetical protein B0H65DRAFT_48320 [Neurospora tetraspora]